MHATARRELVEPLTTPLLPTPGNHDDRDLMRSTIPDMPWVDAEHASWVTTVRSGIVDGAARALRVMSGHLRRPITSSVDVIERIG